MKKKLAILMTAIVSTSALALAGCKTNIGWIDEKICKHEYEFVRITLEPTCTEEGERLMECVDCGKQKTEVMEKIPHDEVVTPGKDPTCTEDGYTEKIVCNVCQEVLQAQEEIPMIAHIDNGEGTCEVCGETLYELVAAEEGELVAGNTYRIYIPSAGGSVSTKLYLSSDTETYFFIFNKYTEGRYIWWSGDSGPSYHLEGFEVVNTDTYVEFNLQPGTYKIFKYDGTDTGDTYVIDETTTITSVDDRVYRVVESDV